MKIVFKTLIFAIIAIFFLIGYLSFIGFETDKFNTQISQKIKKFDKNAQELVYALIKAYQIKNPCTNQHTIPFEGKQLKSGLKFDMTKLPEHLQKIISKFVELHENR